MIVASHALNRSIGTQGLVYAPVSGGEGVKVYAELALPYSR
jgi:hypothetical protein